MNFSSVRVNRMTQVFASTLLLAVAAPLSAVAASQYDNAVIEQSQGVDSSLDYTTLTKIRHVG